MKNTEEQRGAETQQVDMEGVLSSMTCRKIEVCLLNQLFSH